MDERVYLETTTLDTESLVSTRSQSCLYMVALSTAPQKYTCSRSQEIQIQIRNKMDTGRNL